MCVKLVMAYNIFEAAFEAFSWDTLCKLCLLFLTLDHKEKLHWLKNLNIAKQIKLSNFSETFEELIFFMQITETVVSWIMGIPD